MSLLSCLISLDSKLLAYGGWSKLHGATMTGPVEKGWENSDIIGFAWFEKTSHVTNKPCNCFKAFLKIWHLQSLLLWTNCVGTIANSITLDTA